MPNLSARLGQRTAPSLLILKRVQFYLFPGSWFSSAISLYRKLRLLTACVSGSFRGQQKLVSRQLPRCSSQIAENVSNVLADGSPKKAGVRPSRRLAQPVCAGAGTVRPGSRVRKVDGT